MILFTSGRYEPLASELHRAVAPLTIGRFQTSRFQNGELHIDLQTKVTGEHCLVLGSLAPPDEDFLSALLLAHTLKKDGANEVTALFPYLAYARHDKARPGQSLTTAWVGSLAAASGINQVITVDVHSSQTNRLFPIPVVSLSPAPILAEALHQYRLTGATIVAPDSGAIARCDAVKAAAGMPSSQTPYFEKHRTETGIVHTGAIGQVGRQAVLIDDILDTGGTLVSACEKLAEAEQREIHIMVTHGLFTGERWKRLSELGVKRIFCTDSVPLPDHVDVSNGVRLSIVPVIERQLRTLARE
jgi:ribose-phosphate pyrophosphokinase